MEQHNLRMNQYLGASLTGFLVLTATALAGLIMWRMLNAPLSFDTVLSGEDAKRIVSILVDVLYDALSRLIQYLSEGSAAVR